VKRINPLTRYIAAQNGCWLWTGPLDDNGYGRHGAPLAHRVIYELKIGPVPDGTELDHLCRNPRCVNPEHLEPVTHAENVRRGIAGQVNGARQSALQICKRGHEFNEENTGVDYRGHRFCRKCVRQARRLKYASDIERNREYGREKQRKRRAVVHDAAG
jgi:HNH endonuclease